jgi:protein-tyrosine phosphatase
MEPGCRHVLFICSGNYYRSRFAELLFDRLAIQADLRWRAESRGTSVLSLGHHNVGPLSADARSGLEVRGILVGDDPRQPRQLTAADLEGADLIVAICEEEHRPQIEEAFPESAARVLYWQVQDRAYTPPAAALASLEHHITQLVGQLRRGDEPSRASASV